MTNLFRSALLLAAAFRDADLRLAATPDTIPHSADDSENYAELTPTGVILLYAVGRPRSLDLYDALFATVGAQRAAVEPDGRVTVFTYRVPR